MSMHVCHIHIETGVQYASRHPRYLLFFSRWLRNSKARGIARVEGIRKLRPSDGIMLVLLSGLLPACRAVSFALRLDLGQETGFL